jgi:hypothetical protein
MDIREDKENYLEVRLVLVLDLETRARLCGSVGEMLIHDQSLIAIGLHDGPDLCTPYDTI